MLSGDLVVSIKELECLDFLVWLGKGSVASDKLNLSQSSISRAARKVATEFDLEMIKGEGEWILCGDQSCINIERLLHQKIRLNRGHPFRLEVHFTYSGAFSSFIRDKYLLGCCNFLDISKPINLVRLGIVDAWIGGYPDLPSCEDPDLLCIHLTRHPLRLVVHERHPLALLGDSITLNDVVRFPSIALRDGALPETQRHLQSLGLWNSRVTVRRFAKESVMGLTSDQLVVGYASSFSLKLYDEPTVFLPISLDHFVGQTLVVRREYERHPRVQDLLSSLKEECLEFVRKYPDVTLVF